MHRLQTVIFNLVFGIWFIACVLHALPVCTPPFAVTANPCYDLIMPVIPSNDLILIGLSSGAYVAFKTTENNPSKTSMAQFVSNESGAVNQSQAQG